MIVHPKPSEYDWAQATSPDTDTGLRVQAVLFQSEEASGYQHVRCEAENVKSVHRFHQRINHLGQNHDRMNETGKEQCL